LRRCIGSKRGRRGLARRWRALCLGEGLEGAHAGAGESIGEEFPLLKRNPWGWIEQEKWKVERT
jgi:hypothetical protein